MERSDTWRFVWQRRAAGFVPQHALRIGDGYTYTLEEVGKIFKVTRERVRQIEAKAVRKLQHPVRSRMLEGFLEVGARLI